MFLTFSRDGRTLSFSILWFDLGTTYLWHIGLWLKQELQLFRLLRGIRLCLEWLVLLKMWVNCSCTVFTYHFSNHNYITFLYKGCKTCKGRERSTNCYVWGCRCGKATIIQASSAPEVDVRFTFSKRFACQFTRVGFFQIKNMCELNFFFPLVVWMGSPPRRKRPHTAVHAQQPASLALCPCTKLCSASSGLPFLKFWSHHLISRPQNGSETFNMWSLNFWRLESFHY